MSKMVFVYCPHTFAYDMVATYISKKLNNISGLVKRQFRHRRQIHVHNLMGEF